MKPSIIDCYINSPFKSIKHSTYFRSYEYFFSSYRGKKITFVEIGILSGGSLFMWREFFGPEARIIGVDLNPNAKKWERDGFEIYIGSQDDESFWQHFKHEVGGIDIVLDDGGHTYDQQIITTESLLDGMNDNGIIVVEDTHTSYMPGFGPRKYSFLNYIKSKIDRINYRFSMFASDANCERRIWSIEIVESMVALRINKEASNELSIPTNNNGIDDSAADYRDANNKKYAIFLSSAKKLKLLKHLPLAKTTFRFVERVLTTWKFKSKRFF